MAEARRKRQHVTMTLLIIKSPDRWIIGQQTHGLRSPGSAKMIE
jgi:hypothetical protein